ncbi:pyridoxine [Cordyceps fumosorosea ARSEF 2679]|uniref:Pyridoxine n=1 Tax=Cordyceps fumosorosea (strain ARSEF 2679) TaxID=1081104 RepID=A0A167NMJ2_CORFA|nr:pyridoxine [Cordyceps fumosorosea ARSEF 2679]OAA55718.1 pyridoxine [Cordyceps fumosorosea ARSEF 2679]
MQPTTTTVGVLALQGGFSEHVDLVRSAAAQLADSLPTTVTAVEVRTPDDLTRCDALIIPGGESATISLIARRTGLVEPLREFVNVLKKPTWGTCAGLILLSKEAKAAKQSDLALIGGLDVCVHRNHFGRQFDSFTAPLDLPFLPDSATKPFVGFFIRAPIVEEVLRPSTTSDKPSSTEGVTIVARLPDHLNGAKNKTITSEVVVSGAAGDIVAVRQGNVLGTSFHPELTPDARMHAWFLQEFVLKSRA